MKKPNYTLFRPRIRSRHPSHAVLRDRTLPLLPFKSVVRLGSQTEFTKDSTARIEINTTSSIATSCNKLLMKQAFTKGKVETADWFRTTDGLVFTNQISGVENIPLPELPYPIISKSFYGSRNRGNKKHDNFEDLAAWLEGKKASNYIFEKYYNYTREYRIHVSAEGAFYACRKMLKADTPDEDKWYRNDEHCVWIMEDNSLFDRPVNWDAVVAESVKAMKAVGLDMGAVDLRIQSATTEESGKPRKDPKFIIVEINSAPSFGTVTEAKYKLEIPKILKRKFELQNA